MKDLQPIEAADVHVGDMLMAGGIVDPKAKTVGAVLVVDPERAHLGVIERGNYISMAAQMRTKERGRATVATAVMRKDDRRISSRMGRSVANSRLVVGHIAWRNGEDVLSFRSEVLTLMLRRGGVPDLARE